MFAATPKNKDITEAEALSKGMEDKAKEFVEKGGEVYTTA